MGDLEETPLKMGDFEEEQREEVDALVSIFSEEMTVIFLDIL